MPIMPAASSTCSTARSSSNAAARPEPGACGRASMSKIGNYLTVAFRNLLRHRAFAFINISGLALGLAACLLIYLYVGYETRYDEWLPDAGRVYQVQTLFTDPETGDRRHQQATEGVVADSLAKDFPQIEAIARADGDRQILLDRTGEAANA